MTHPPRTKTKAVRNIGREHMGRKVILSLDSTRTVRGTLRGVNRLNAAVFRISLTDAVFSVAPHVPPRATAVRVNTYRPITIYPEGH